MMQEIIDITPEMMHKFYNNNNNNELVDKKNSKFEKYKFYNTDINTNISIELKMCLLVLFMLFVVPLIIYVLSVIPYNSYYQKLH